MPVDLQDLSRRLFQTANQLWTNTALRPDQYAQPVLALIALRQMEAKFDVVHADLAKTFTGRLKPTPGDYQGRGAVFLPDQARFSYLLGLPETENLAEALNEAMKGITENNPDLAGVMPQGYGSLPNSVLRELLRLLSPLKIEGDAYGLIFEYFMGEFASTFMQKGGEYFTPSSIVKLIVEVIEPYHGKIFDPACGSGGMFVHSAEFVRRHHKNPSREISLYGTEKMEDTQKLCRLNLAVHGLSGDVRVANSYYEDPHGMVGKFDFLMANPPFNQSEVDRDRLVNEAGKVDARFSLGIPTTNNANYLWIGLFNAALNASGRGGFVMANSASDAGGSEREMRRKLIETGAVDVIITTSPNMFFTVTLPVTLWFLDKGKAKGDRADEVLFIDARHIFRQVTRAYRDFTPDQIEFLGNIVRMWRGEEQELVAGSGPTEKFDARYAVVDGDILIGMDGIFHMAQWVGGDAALNQRVTRLRPISGFSKGWVFRAVHPHIKSFEATISGTTVAHLGAKHLNTIRVRVADPEVQGRADRFFEPIDEALVKLRIANERLSVSRDLLLPRLISGQLSVAAAERELEEAA